jgi:hypothetical protein
MDPFTGLNVACNIIDIAERTLKCAQNVRDVYTSGVNATKIQEAQLSQCETMRACCADLKSKVDSASQNQLDLKFHKVAQESLKEAECLRKVLEERIPESRIKQYCRAIKESYFGDSKINECMRRFEAHKQELQAIVIAQIL